MREQLIAFRQAVRHGRGPIGTALLMSLMSVLLCGSELAMWTTARRPPMAAIVLFPISALGMWRQVQFETDVPVGLWCRRGRIALLILAMLVAIYGVYGWGWHGINVATPFLAALALVLELRHQSPAASSTTAGV